MGNKEQKTLAKEVAYEPVRRQAIQLHAQKSIEMLEAYAEHDAGAALQEWR